MSNTFRSAAFFVIAAASTPDLRLTQPLSQCIPGVRRPQLEAVHSVPRLRIHAGIPRLLVFVTCFIKHRKGFVFYVDQYTLFPTLFRGFIYYLVSPGEYRILSCGDNRNIRQASPRLWCVARIGNWERDGWELKGLMISVMMFVWASLNLGACHWGCRPSDMSLVWLVNAVYGWLVNHLKTSGINAAFCIYGFCVVLIVNRDYLHKLHEPVGSQPPAMLTSTFH
jgi:hypothetical protein